MFDFCIVGLQLAELITATTVSLASSGSAFSSVPVVGSGWVLKIARGLQLLRIIRLLRVVRLFRYIARWEDTLVTLTSTTLRMLKLILIVLVFSHWNGKIE